MKSSDGLQQIATPSEESASARRFRFVAGLLAIFVASLFFSCTHALTKYIYNSSTLSPWELIYWRSLILFLFNLAILHFSTRDSEGATLLAVPRKFSCVLLLRVITGVLSNFLTFLQTKVMNISRAVALFFTYPSFTMIFAWLMLGEHVSAFDSLGCAFSFAGVLLVVLESDTTGSDFKGEKWFAPLIPLGSAVFIAFSNVWGRALGRDVHFAVSPALFGVGCAVVSPALYSTGLFGAVGAVHRHSAGEFGVIALIGLAEALGQTLMAKALQIEKAGRVAAVAYTQVVNACLIDLLIFKVQILGLEWAGIAAVVGSNGLILALKLCGIIS